MSAVCQADCEVGDLPLATARGFVTCVCVCEYARGLSYAFDRKYDIDI